MESEDFDELKVKRVDEPDDDLDNMVAGKPFSRRALLKFGGAAAIVGIAGWLGLNALAPELVPGPVKTYPTLYELLTIDWKFTDTGETVTDERGETYKIINGSTKHKAGETVIIEDVFNYFGTGPHGRKYTISLKSLNSQQGDLILNNVSGKIGDYYKYHGKVRIRMRVINLSDVPNKSGEWPLPDGLTTELKYIHGLQVMPDIGDIAGENYMEKVA